MILWAFKGTGGYTTIAFENMIEHGTTLENCVGYSSSDGVDPHSCMGSGGVWERWTGCDLNNEASNSTVKGEASYGLFSEAEMMSDIYLNGPIQTTFLLENDMYGQ